MEYTYLLINIFTIASTLVASFDKRLNFYKKWKYLFPAIFITGTIFIVWDVWFTDMGVWSFNPKYLTGISILNLPLEEWLFFITVPYSCVFIYESLNYFFRNTSFDNKIKVISASIASILLLTGLINITKIYTSITLIATGIILLIATLAINSSWLEKFFRAYLIHLIPFFIVNGILTYLPVVQYNDSQNLGFRLFSIPIEDSIYSMLLLLMNIFFFDLFRGNLQFVKFQLFKKRLNYLKYTTK